MTPEEEGPVGVGRRVRAARKLHTNLSQQQLADRMHVSLSLVQKVEQGLKPATHSFVTEAARALNLTVYDLYDQPSPQFGAEREGIAGVETAVIAGPALASDARPKPLDRLGEAVDQVAELQRRSRYHRSSALMPDLLEALHTAAAQAQPGAEAERAHYLLASLYQCATICLHRLGSPLAGQAAERAADAATQSGDPLLAALCRGEIGLPLMHRGAYDAAERLAAAGRALVETEPTGPGSLTVRGYLHLRSAILAARVGDRSTSDAHLAEAASCAARLPADADLYDTAFSATNVRIHDVAAAVELGDGGTALSRNTPLPPGTMTSRQGHHHIDLARAWLLHGKREQAFEELNTARVLAPQLTRYHPQVRETLVTLAYHDRRKSDTLAGFARWAGIRL
ncbi:helix-turn-helix domain-containing protein [Amycolatopsis aidingensis]|uniref:helix-turn-helix domain-containing protein n=1 Tax=Amycolatopsis aidingensis TaxID=2842453 RepID=UPI001C0ABD3F|nr:helix-turn-helix transcriptional regulator [Amycolatopsis aidingensis]